MWILFEKVSIMAIRASAYAFIWIYYLWVCADGLCMDLLIWVTFMLMDGLHRKDRMGPVCEKLSFTSMALRFVVNIAQNDELGRLNTFLTWLRGREREREIWHTEQNNYIAFIYYNAYFNRSSCFRYSLYS